MASENDVQLDEKNIARQGTVAIKLSELAKNIDIDGDGNIDEDEKRILDTLKEMDIDGDGNISLKELVNLGKQLNIAEEQRKTYKKFIFLILLFAVAAISATFLACLGAVEAAKDARPDGSGVMLTTSVTGASKVVQTQAHVDTIKITDLYKATYTTLDGVKNMGFQVGASFYSYTVTGFQQDLKGDGTSAVRFYTSRGDTIYITSTASLLELKAGGTVDISAAATLTRHLLSARDLLDHDSNMEGTGAATVTNGVNEYDPMTVGAMANATAGNVNATPSVPSNFEMKIMQTCATVEGSSPEKRDDNSVECVCNDGFTGELETTFDGLNFTVAGACALATQPDDTNCWMDHWYKASGFPQEKDSKRVQCECPYGSHSGKVEWSDDGTQKWISTCALKTNIPKAIGNKPFTMKKWESTMDGLKSRSYEFVCPPTYVGGNLWWDYSSSQWQRTACQPAPCERGTRDEKTSPATCKCYPHEYGKGAKWQNNNESPSDSQWISADPSATDPYNLADTCKPKPPCPDERNNTQLLNHTTGACDCRDKYVGGHTFDESTEMWLGSCDVAPCPAFAEKEWHGAFNPECKCASGYTAKSEGLWWNHTTKVWNGVCEPKATCPQNTVPMGSGDDSRCECGLGYSGWTEYFHHNNSYVNHCEKIVCPDSENKVLKKDMYSQPPMSYCDCKDSHPNACWNYTTHSLQCQLSSAPCVYT